MEEIKELDLTKLETAAGGASGGESIHFTANIYKGNNYIDCIRCISYGNVSARAIRMSHANQTKALPENVHVSIMNGPELDYEKDLATNGVSEGSILIIVIDE